MLFLKELGNIIRKKEMGRSWNSTQSSLKLQKELPVQKDSGGGEGRGAQSLWALWDLLSLLPVNDGSPGIQSRGGLRVAEVKCCGIESAHNNTRNIYIATIQISVDPFFTSHLEYIPSGLVVLKILLSLGTHVPPCEILSHIVQ